MLGITSFAGEEMRLETLILRILAEKSNVSHKYNHELDGTDGGGCPIVSLWMDLPSSLHCAAFMDLLGSVTGKTLIPGVF